MNIVNTNLTTGIRYGVTSHADILIEEIQQNGTNETFEAHKADCVNRIAALLEEMGQRNAEDTAREIVDNFEWDDYNADEESYSYDDGKGNKFRLGYLGGAPLVWCIETTAIVYAARLCSPCVPNAADLDSGLTDEASGYQCYGIPAEYRDDERQD